MTTSPNPLVPAAPVLTLVPAQIEPAQVEIVIPVKDEEGDLAPSIARLHDYLAGSFRGILRLGGGHRLARFAAIGVASTLAYAAIYLALRHVLAAQAANALSLLITALANTAANRRLTFGIGGTRHAVRHQLRGLIAFTAALALTSGALAATLRFGLYRSWVFRGAGA